MPSICNNQPTMDHLLAQLKDVQTEKKLEEQLCSVGLTYLFGSIGINYDQALFHLEKASKATTLGRALYIMALYQTGLKAQAITLLTRFKSDHTQWTDFLTRAHSKETPWATYCLGRFHLEANQYQEALNCYRKLNLAIVDYDKGLLREKGLYPGSEDRIRYDSALHLYKRAQKKGLPLADFRIGRLREKGVHPDCLGYYFIDSMKRSYVLDCIIKIIDHQPC